MPYMKIETNTALDGRAGDEMLKKTSAFIATLLGKPEQYCMVSIDLAMPMMFSGTTGPAAYVELKSIGLREGHCTELSGKICEFLERELSVAPERVYIEFTQLNGKMFGWNKQTFQQSRI